MVSTEPLTEETNYVAPITSHAAFRHRPNLAVTSLVSLRVRHGDCLGVGYATTDIFIVTSLRLDDQRITRCCNRGIRRPVFGIGPVSVKVQGAGTSCRAKPRENCSNRFNGCRQRVMQPLSALTKRSINCSPFGIKLRRRFTTVTTEATISGAITRVDLGNPAPALFNGPLALAALHQRSSADVFHGVLLFRLDRTSMQIAFRSRGTWWSLHLDFAVPRFQFRESSFQSLDFLPVGILGRRHVLIRLATRRRNAPRTSACRKSRPQYRTTDPTNDAARYDTHY